MLRGLWDDAYAWVTRHAPEGTVRWHVVTWIGHTTLTLACVLVVSPLLLVGLDWREAAARVGAGFYTIDTVRQVFFRGAGSTVPWWDDVMDMVGPWLVVWTFQR